MHTAKLYKLIIKKNYLSQQNTYEINKIKTNKVIKKVLLQKYIVQA